MDPYDTIVIGGSQAGLSLGYELKKRGVPFLILEANERVGDAWRGRWDSMRLFTPAKFNGLRGMPFPGPRNAKPTKDEFADYLDAYAARFALPVRTRVKVTCLEESSGRFVVEAGGERLEAERVVVATGAHQTPRIPEFARDLDADIVQIHSLDYRRPAQLQPGGVLVVGLGNSGADIAMEVVREHPTWVAGKPSAVVPFRIDSFKARFLVHIVKFVGYRVLTRSTPIGRKLAPKFVAHAAPLIRVKPKDMAAAGIQRVPRVAGVRDGKPLLEDGRVLDVANVIWCTGFRQDFSWIDLPALDSDGMPLHDRGVVEAVPGLYFLGLVFQYAATSDVIVGVGRDAAYVADDIMAARSNGTRAAAVLS